MRLHRTFLPLAGAIGFGALAWRRRQRLLSTDLTGRVAIVTGASRGLGFRIARRLAREGCRLVISARDEQELSEARDRLRLEGVPVWTVVADHTDKAQCEHVVTEALRVFGDIDILVNNAGQIRVAPLECVTTDDFTKAMDLMFWGMLHTTFAALPHFKEKRRGTIVNIASLGGLVPVPHLLPYVAAKFAAAGFSKGLYAELRRSGICVTTVAPSTMRTGGDAHAKYRGKARQEQLWFRLAANLPGIAVDADHAADRIVRALKRQAPYVAIGWPTPIATTANGLFPSLTLRALSVVDRLLPSPPVNGPDRSATFWRVMPPGALPRAPITN